jgi:hypothetical protein
MVFPRNDNGRGIVIFSVAMMIKMVDEYIFLIDVLLFMSIYPTEEIPFLARWAM